MDPALIGAIIGVVGSVMWAILGAIIGYKLAIRKADISLFAKSRIAMYYLKGVFCVYVPITLANEGNKGAAVCDLQATLKSHNGQKWFLGWPCFSNEGPASDYTWIDGDRAEPIYIHENSTTQKTIKLIAVVDNVDDTSSVIFTPGVFSIEISYREKQGAKAKSQIYSFTVTEKDRSALEKRRLEPENMVTYIFTLQEGGKGEAFA